MNKKLFEKKKKGSSFARHTCPSTPATESLIGFSLYYILAHKLSFAFFLFFLLLFFFFLSLLFKKQQLTRKIRLEKRIRKT